MKVKNNTKNLIPRKQIGGQIPKFQKASGKLFTRQEYERRYSNRNYNKAHLLNGKWHRAILNRDKNGNETVTLQTWKPLPKNYYVKNGGIYEKTGLGDIRVDTYKGSRYEAGKPAPNHKHLVDHSVTQAEIDNAKKLNAGIQAPKNKSTDIKPARTKGNGTKGSIRGRRGNARTTVKPATTTFTESPTNITDQSWLDARNAAMQRGWGTYNYNGQTYQFTGDEFQQAKRNWNNRRKAGYQAEGLLNLPSINVPDNLVFDNNYARKIESTVPQTKPVDTKTTPYTLYYQQQIAKNPNLTREALWQATQAVRNGDRDASYYGESSGLVSQLANANQDSAKNYIYNLWNTDNDVATQAGRRNYTESQGLTFGESTTSNANKDPLQSWATGFLKRSARQGTKLISRKQ